VTADEIADVCSGGDYELTGDSDGNTLKSAPVRQGGYSLKSRRSRKEPNYLRPRLPEVQELILVPG
jgi:hypothetical protein